MGRVSVKAFARRKGVTQQAVQKALKRGRITRGADGKIDTEAADRDWEDNANPVARTFGTQGKQSGKGNGAAGALLLNAQAVRMRALAERAQLETKKLRGEVIDVDRVRAIWSRIFATVRAQFLSLPTVLRTDLPHLTLDDTQLIERRVHEILNAVSEPKHYSDDADDN